MYSYINLYSCDYLHKILIKINVATNEGNGCLGYLVPGPHIRPSSAPIKFSTSSFFSYLKSSHYDHVHITFSDLRVM